MSIDRADAKSRWRSTLLLFCAAFACQGIPAQATASAAPQATQWSIPLNGPWKFRTGDDPDWASPQFNDRTWGTLDIAAPASANDGDQGISHFASGWEAHGYNGYSGFAWYRLSVARPLAGNERLAILGPAMVDNAYQIYVNGTLLGGIGDFSQATPVIYGIHPMKFETDAPSSKPILIAVRVWMAPWAASPASGGMHVAPILGNVSGADLAFKAQWYEKIRAFALEIAQTFFFVVLALAALSLLLLFDSSDVGLIFFALALLLTAAWRANLAIYWLSHVESVQTFFYAVGIGVVPMTLGAWTLAWCYLLHVRYSTWITSVTLALTVLYAVAEFLKLAFFNGNLLPALASIAGAVAKFDRYAFLALLVFIVYYGFKEHRRETWMALPVILLISIGQFSGELTALGVPGIWFPFGMGVSLTNWAYLCATFAIPIFLWMRLRASRRDVTVLRTVLAS